MFWWFVVSVALMILGAFGPWAKVFVANVSGVDGDGWFVVLAAVLAGVMLYQHEKRAGAARWPMIVSAVAGAIAFLVVTVDAIDIYGGEPAAGGESLFGDTDLVSPGWGLVMDHIASLSLVAASIAFLLRGRSSADVAPASPPPGV